MNESGNRKRGHRKKLNWWQRYRRYAQLCQTSGFIPKKIPWVFRLGQLIARIWAFIMIGKVKVVGAEYLKPDQYTIYCPNHSSMLDAVAVVPLMHDNIHFMAAHTEMKGVFGLKGIVMGAMGCFPVDRENGRSVLEPATDLVADANCLMLFPEGKISPSGEYLVFKKGAAWIGIGAYKKLNYSKPVKYVPMHICFGTRHEDSALDFSKMFFHWRKGVTVTADPPIFLSDFEELDADHVIARIRSDITDAECATTSGV